MGWVLMFLALFNILVNLSLIGKSSISDCIDRIKKKRRDKKTKADLDKKIASIKYLKDNMKSKFRSFEKELDCHEAIQFSRTWFETRWWLVANKIDITEFPEE